MSHDQPMTPRPAEPSPTPESVPASEPAQFHYPPAIPVASDPRQAPVTGTALDDGTYTRLVESRSASRLALDGVWHQISPRYVPSQVVASLILVVIVAMAALVLYSVTDQYWPLWAGGALAVITLAPLIVLPRQARALGYMLRADDIVFRKGILWQRMIAVPFGRLQLVDITQGPLDRAFGLSQLKMVTAAATTGVQIPGLSGPASESLRDTLIAVAESRRTGL